MSGFFTEVLQGAIGTAKDTARGAVNGFFANDFVRDYTHASKTFLPNAHQYAPRFKFLFHVYFDINRSATVFDNNDHLSLTVKTIKLPTYSFDTHVLNQYNRKRIVQTKMKYEPVQMTFHDDGGNLSRDLWKTYSQYYYGDLRKKRETSSSPAASSGAAPSTDVVSLNARTQYQPTWGDAGQWGYQAENIQGQQPPKASFFNSIVVYGFHQHNFVMYKLVNPIITQFSHDTYSYSEGSGVMENTMTVDYETVIYDSGKLDGRDPSKLVKDFAGENNYDRRPSPAATPGSNGSILGQGGLLDAAGGIFDDLRQQPPNILGAIRTAGISYNTFKNGGLKKAVKNEVNAVVSGAINDNIRSGVKFLTPAAATTPVSADKWKTSVTNATDKLNFTQQIINSRTGTGQNSSPVPNTGAGGGL